jgi:hypothetical protein
MSYPRPIEPDDLDRDDEFLDLLGRGEMPAGGDQAELMLAAWRADLSDAELSQRSLRSAVPTPDETAQFPVRPTATLTRPMPNGRRAPTGPEPHRPGRRRTRRIRLAIAAAAVALLGAGVAITAANATPDSPLWPVAQLLFPQRADRLGAQDLIARAQTAIREGRLADAQRLVAQAQSLVAQVDDPVERGRLQGELDQVRQLLSAAVGVISPGAGPSAQPSPAGGPGPSASSTPPPLLPSQLPNPGLPSVLPTGILPTQILPSLLPSLPILGGG